jgi:hypothetical protein
MTRSSPFLICNNSAPMAVSKALLYDTKRTLGNSTIHTAFSTLSARTAICCKKDHSSLQWLINFKEPQGQLARWPYNHSLDRLSRKWTILSICATRTTANGITSILVKSCHFSWTRLQCLQCLWFELHKGPVVKSTRERFRLEFNSILLTNNSWTTGKDFIFS